MCRAGGKATLFVDGSQDGNQGPITHIVAVQSDQTPFFIKQIHHGTETHSSENIITHVNECEAFLKTHGIHLNGIVSDNEPKMRKVRQEFYNDRGGDPANVFASPGDPPHALQLVIGDILTSDVLNCQSISTKAQYVASKFKNTR